MSDSFPGSEVRDGSCTSKLQYKLTWIILVFVEKPATEHDWSSATMATIVKTHAFDSKAWKCSSEFGLLCGESFLKQFQCAEFFGGFFVISSVAIFIMTHYHSLSVYLLVFSYLKDKIPLTPGQSPSLTDYLLTHHHLIPPGGLFNLWGLCEAMQCRQFESDKLPAQLFHNAGLRCLELQNLFSSSCTRQASLVDCNYFSTYKRITKNWICQTIPTALWGFATCQIPPSQQVKICKLPWFYSMKR